MRNSGTWWIIIALMVLLDIYVFQALKTIVHNRSAKTKKMAAAVYWTISGITLLTLIFLPYLQLNTYVPGLQSVVFATLISMFFAKLLAALFFLIDDIRRLTLWIVRQRSSKKTVAAAPATDTGDKMSRSVFFSWLGMAMGGTVVGTMLYGISNRYSYQLHQHRLQFAKLPPAFNGLKIIHISDIHSGSFTDKAAVKKGIDLIMEQKPDIIFFTGDLVNDQSVEMDNYLDVFAGLTAPMGVYSTLGNHDYGDYHRWESETAKKANLQRLKEMHAEMGWRLLMNENLALEKDGETISLIGIENWSANPRFPRLGDMPKAYEGVKKDSFQILLSHDPTHWDAQVRPEYADIDLMLAGHTHGMQFGVELPWFKWSPAQFIYKQWAGLYESKEQKLYVNRGYGFIGYPGRVGILPEITLIELATKA